MSNWSRTDNFIITATQKSYIGAKGIFDSFDLKLKMGIADPDIQNFYNDFHPLCLAYDDGYSSWNSLRSRGPSTTLGVVQLLEQLSSTLIRAWDIAIQSVYDNTTTEYKSLLPHHRIPFQTGSINSRAIAINSLITAIGTDANLATLKTKIAGFYSLLTAAMILQKSQLQNIDNAILVLDAACKTASEEAYKIYGSFVVKFYKTPKSIDVFFPVSLLKSLSQSNFTATLSNDTPKKVFKRKLDVTKHTLKYTNVGTSIVNAYFTNGLTDLHTPGTPIFAMLPNTMAECNPTEMGYTDANKHLHIVNTGNETANIEIDIMAIN